MKKILLLIMTLIVSMTTFAQSDIVSVADAIKIFQTKTLYTGQQVLEKQGYIYKGISTDSYGKDYNWVKNMNLTKDFVPTAFAKTVYVYVFNRTAFAGIQAQVRAMGYDMGKAAKSSKGTLICTKDNQPTITFMTLQMPLPFCMQITE